jgi:hypothetical protein
LFGLEANDLEAKLAAFVKVVIRCDLPPLSELGLVVLTRDEAFMPEPSDCFRSPAANPS